MLPPYVVLVTVRTGKLYLGCGSGVGGTRTCDALWVILDTLHTIMRVAENDLGQTLGLDVRSSGGGVESLHDDHVAAVASFLEKSTDCGVGLEGGADFDDVAADGDWNLGMSGQWYRT